MRLLFIANDFPNPYYPTKGVFNLSLARALAERHEVRVIAPVSWVDELRARRRGLPPLRRATAVEGVAVRYPRYLYPPKILRNLYGWFYRRSIRRAVRETLSGFSPDAVVGYWAHPDGEAAVRVARALNVPSAVIVGGSDVLLITKNGGRRRRVARVLRSADAVVTVNQHLRHKSIELGADPERVHAWSQGVDGSVFRPGDRAAARLKLGLPPDGRVLVWVGRMAPVKGLDVLLSAVRLLRDGAGVPDVNREEPDLPAAAASGRSQEVELEGVNCVATVPGEHDLPGAGSLDVTLHLVGDGPLRAELQAAVARLDLSDAVSFVGPRPHEHLADWYRAADMTVLPSRSEGLPNVLRESLACGTPFVASDVGGIRELAAGGFGRLVPPEDPAALAAAIRNMLESPPTPAPAAVAPPTWGQSADAFARILLPLLSPPVTSLPKRAASMSLVR